MRAHEFITEKKNRKRRNKYGVPAYGPGPYGGYGYYAGYSGDSGSGSDGGGVGEDIVTELKITDKDVQRIIKDKLAIDADSGVEAMRLAIEKMSSLPSTSYVRSQSSQLMMLYKRAKMSIGGDYYRKLNKLAENFADGKNPQDKGDSKRHGIPKNATIAQLKKIRSSSTASPRKKQLAHWQINMRQGRKKK